MTALVLTVAACGGTTTGTTGGVTECCHNPPAIVFVAAPPLSVGDSVARSPDGTCTFHGANGEARLLSGCPVDLQSPGRIWRAPNGDCQLDRPIECPPPSEATCNPPAPEVIACPSGSPDVRPIGPTMNPPAPAQ